MGEHKATTITMWHHLNGYRINHNKPHPLETLGNIMSWIYCLVPGMGVLLQSLMAGDGPCLGHHEPEFESHLGPIWKNDVL